MRPALTEQEAAVRKAVQAIIRPIVIGQLKAFCSDHPEALHPKWVASIEKRITNDLLSGGSRLRLRSALCGELRPQEPAMDGCGCKAASCGTRRACARAPRTNAGLAEQADAAGLSPAALGREGSTPSAGTIMHVSV